MQNDESSATGVIDAPTVADLERRRESTTGALIPSHAAAEAESTPGRVYYGWYMLLMAMGVAIASSPGQTFGVSIFNEPLRQELALSHGQLALAYTLGTLLGAIPITWIGYQMDRRGLRATTLVTLCVFCIACLVMAGVTSWLHLVLAFTMLRMLGPGALSMLSGNVLPFWFSRQLGTVEGLRQTAMAVAMALIPPLNVWLVAVFGWRSAYAILGAGVWLLMFPLCWRYFRNAPEEVGQELDGLHSSHRVSTSVATPAPQGVRSIPSTGPARTIHSTAADLTFAETVRTGAFWIVLTGTSLFCMISTGVFFCLVPIFAEHGWGEQHAATMLVVFAVSLAVHQVAGGRIADLIAPPLQLAAGMLMYAGALGLLWSGLSVGAMMLGGALLGAAQGVYFASAQPLWARYFGRAHLGKLRGVQMAINVASSSLGPLMVGACRDLLGGFGPVLLLFALLPIPFAISSRWARPIRDPH